MAVPLLLVLPFERLGGAAAPLGAAPVVAPPAAPVPLVASSATAAAAAAAPGRRQLLPEVAEGPRDGRRARHGLGPVRKYCNDLFFANMKT